MDDSNSTTADQSSQGQPGTTSYNEGVDGAGRTLNVLRDLDSFLGSPFKNFVTSRTSKKRLQLELGEWHDFLYDTKRDIYLTPVLSATRFHKYIISCKGAFQPQGQCRATAVWAQFLYGLGITPGKDIVSRKVSKGGEEHGVVLEVDGEVVCHVVNLLQKAEESRRRAMGYINYRLQSEGSHTTSIGKIKWLKDPETGSLDLSYQPLSEAELSSHHSFFPDKNHRDPDILMARYFLSHQLGTSYTELVWPPSSVPLHERLQKTGEFSQLLKYPDDEIMGSHRPVFITGKWCEDSEWIYRRAFGGEQVDEFIENIRVRLNPDSPVYDKAVEWLRDCVKSPRPHVLEYFDSSSSLRYTIPFSATPVGREISSALTSTLESYGEEPEGSWKHKSFLCRDQTPSKLEKGIYAADQDYFILVPLDCTAAIWQETGLQLKGM